MIGIIIAGGRSRRMGGGDKTLRDLGGATVLDRVIAVMRTQCDQIILNANGDPERFAATGLTVVPDENSGAADGPQGPLAGVLAGLNWVAAHHPKCLFAVTAPGDTPFLPLDLVARLQDMRAEDRSVIACARSGGTVHPVAALWQVALRHDLRRAIAGEGARKMTDFLDRHPVAYADWPVRPHDPFLNLNTPEDFARAALIAPARP